MTAGRRHALDTIADLLGLPRLAVRAVERRANGDYAIVLRRRFGREVPRWARSKSVLRIPARRIEGYRPRSPYVRERDRRARRKVNAERFAWWLYWRLTPSAPVVERALGGKLEAVAELRAAILAAAPEPELEVVFVYYAGNNGDGAAHPPPALADELEPDPAAPVCAICGAALDGRRTDARYCGSACRREACRIRRLVDGLPDAGYRTLDEYLAARQRRAKRAWSASP